MAFIAARIGTHSTLSLSLAILVVIVVLAAGYFSGRKYVNRRFNSATGNSPCPLRGRSPAARLLRPT
jgi:hypothetical protein